VDKQLINELKIYIEKYKRDDIIIRERDVCDYIIPMKSSMTLDRAYEDKALPKDIKPRDSSCFEQFRKKPLPKVEEYQDIPYSRSLVSEEDELEGYIRKEKSKETFSTRLLQYIDRTELSDAEIYKKAGIDRRHFSKIRCDKYYQPKKATVLALCIALKLTIDEALDLLGLAGYSLSSSDTGDLVVKFCIEKGIYDLVEVNEALEYFGQKLIGVVS